MARLPIKIQKIKSKGLNNTEYVQYLVIVSDKGTYWEQTAIVDRADLTRLRDSLNEILADSTTAEILGATEEQGARIDVAHKSDVLCRDCQFKMTHNCKTCLFTLQSPLERKLFIELKKANIHFQPQYALNWYGQQISVAGKSYGDPTNNFKDVLTVVDFYIEKRDVKLCVYTDGHTYHVSTEVQAQRDRTIDR
jgi:hypothetical protein